MSCFFSIFHPVIDIPDRNTTAFLLFSLEWALSSPLLFTLFFSFCLKSQLFISPIPIQCVFLCIIFLNYFIVVFFSCSLLPFTCFCSSVPLIQPFLFFLNHKSWWGRVCVGTRQEKAAPGGWAGEEHASVTCF